MEKKHLLVLIGILFVLMIILIGPMDYFTHGFFVDDDNYDMIDNYDDNILLLESSSISVVEFTPLKSHFVGIEIYFVKQDNTNGTLNITVSDAYENIIEYQSIPCEKIKGDKWYKIYLEKDYRIGEKFFIKLSVDEDVPPLGIPIVDKIYHPKETIYGNIMIRYAYAESTFSFSDKVLISILLGCIWCGIAVLLIHNKKNLLTQFFVFASLTFIALWNYMNYSFIAENDNFDNFEDFSEMLVIGKIWANKDGTDWFYDSDKDYNLARYENLRGVYECNTIDYISDDQWEEGYSKIAPAVAIDLNELTWKITTPNNYIIFANGEEYQISERVVDGNFIIVYLLADHILDCVHCGSLDDARFYSADNIELPTSAIVAYRSHYGLQGLVFSFLSRLMDDNIELMRLLCAAVTAITFVILTMLLRKKYNTLLAASFYMVWLLSPWISNFARNLYWVEFTWFIPMVAGVTCSLNTDNPKWRRSSYVMIYLSILIRALCGYEYISTIMMSTVTFLAADVFMVFVEKKDKARRIHAIRVFSTACTMAFLGFVTALLIHARLKGNGNVVDGLVRILQDDVMRRTNGADLNVFDSSYWPSMNASVWEVVSTYFHFKTDLITGISGKLFSIICVLTIAVHLYDYWMKKLNPEMLFLYFWFLVAVLSWYCLAKSHSFVHVHLNYVLWYLGFIPICFYTLIEWMIDVICNRIKGSMHKTDI